MLLAITLGDGTVHAHPMVWDPSDRSWRPDWDAPWPDEIVEGVGLDIVEYGIYEGGSIDYVTEPDEDEDVWYRTQVIPETEEEERWLRNHILRFPESKESEIEIVRRLNFNPKARRRRR